MQVRPIYKYTSIQLQRVMCTVSAEKKRWRSSRKGQRFTLTLFREVEPYKIVTQSGNRYAANKYSNPRPSALRIWVKIICRRPKIREIVTFPKATSPVLAGSFQRPAAIANAEVSTELGLFADALFANVASKEAEISNFPIMTDWLRCIFFVSSESLWPFDQNDLKCSAHSSWSINLCPNLVWL